MARRGFTLSGLSKTCSAVGRESVHSSHGFRRRVEARLGDYRRKDTAMESDWKSFHLAIVLVVILLLFGAKKLPELGRSLGEHARLQGLP